MCGPRDHDEVGGWSDDGGEGPRKVQKVGCGMPVTLRRAMCELPCCQNFVFLWSGALSRSHPPKPSHDLAHKGGVRDLGSLGSRILEESSHPRICSARNAADITLPLHERPRAAPAHTRGDKQTQFDHTTTISPRLTVRAIRPMRSAFITCSASRTVGICTHASPCELYPATVFLHGAGMPGESKSLSRTLCVCQAQNASSESATTATPDLRCSATCVAR